MLYQFFYGRNIETENSANADRVEIQIHHSSGLVDEYTFHLVDGKWDPEYTKFLRCYNTAFERGRKNAAAELKLVLEGRFND